MVATLRDIKPQGFFRDTESLRTFRLPGDNRKVEVQDAHDPRQSQPPARDLCCVTTWPQDVVPADRGDRVRSRRHGRAGLRDARRGRRSGLPARRTDHGNAGLCAPARTPRGKCRRAVRPAPRAAGRRTGRPHARSPGVGRARRRAGPAPPVRRPGAHGGGPSERRPCPRPRRPRHAARGHPALILALTGVSPASILPYTARRPDTWPARRRRRPRA
ncbi:conserved hypothetical protein, partial [Ricinus communis]